MPTNKDYIMKKCQSFTQKQNMCVLKYLVEAGVKTCESGDGSRVQHDLLSKKKISLLKKKII